MYIVTKGDSDVNAACSSIMPRIPGDTLCTVFNVLIIIFMSSFHFFIFFYRLLLFRSADTPAQYPLLETAPAGMLLSLFQFRIVHMLSHYTRTHEYIYDGRKILPPVRLQSNGLSACRLLQCRRDIGLAAHFQMNKTRLRMREWFGCSNEHPNAQVKILWVPGAASLR